MSKARSLAALWIIELSYLTWLYWPWLLGLYDFSRGYYGKSLLVSVWEDVWPVALAWPFVWNILLYVLWEMDDGSPESLEDQRKTGQDS